MEREYFRLREFAETIQLEQPLVDEKAFSQSAFSLPKAALLGDPPSVRSILEFMPSQDVQAAITAPGEHGRTPLHLAALGGHCEALRTMLSFVIMDDNVDGGEDIFGKLGADDFGDHVAHLATASSGRLPLAAECLQVLASHKISLHERDGNGQTCLLVAARIGNIAAVRLLLHATPDVINVEDQHGLTPLARASSSGHTDIVSVLLMQGALNETGRCPAIIFAARNGHADVVRLIATQYTGEVFRTDEKGWTCLDWAADNGDQGLVTLSLALMGENIPDKRRVLETACARGHAAVAKQILDHCGLSLSLCAVANAGDERGTWGVFQGDDFLPELAATPKLAWKNFRLFNEANGFTAAEYVKQCSHSRLRHIADMKAEEARQVAAAAKAAKAAKKAAAREAKRKAREAEAKMNARARGRWGRRGRGPGSRSRSRSPIRRRSQSPTRRSSKSPTRRKTREHSPVRVRKSSTGIRKNIVTKNGRIAVETQSQSSAKMPPAQAQKEKIVAGRSEKALRGQTGRHNDTETDKSQSQKHAPMPRQQNENDVSESILRPIGRGGSRQGRRTPSR